MIIGAPKESYAPMIAQRSLIEQCGKRRAIKIRRIIIFVLTFD
jgi:hypothetical protein